jgi:hypothetical protein
MPIRIDNETVSDRPWSDVDKTALARRLADNGDTGVIREAFAYVPDLENRSACGGPAFVERLATEVERKRGITSGDLLNKTPPELQQRFRKQFPDLARRAANRLR